MTTTWLTYKLTDDYIYQMITSRSTVTVCCVTNCWGPVQAVA